MRRYVLHYGHLCHSTRQAVSHVKFVVRERRLQCVKGNAIWQGAQALEDVFVWQNMHIAMTNIAQSINIISS